jgi:cytochrome c5
MKKINLFLGITVMFLLSTSAIVAPAKATGEKSIAFVSAASVPDDLKVIFKNSCMDCHATGGKGMAMAKLNFSDWDNYSADKQSKKAAAICKIITKDAMPPKSYVEKKPAAILTAAQKEMICKWSETLTPKK